MISFEVAKVVVSGSFRKNIVSLKEQYHELIETNCQVLSPRSIDFNSQSFVRSQGELDLSIKSIQDNHLASLKEADFVWLHCPDGYVGSSGAFEIGFARALQIPIFGKDSPADEMLKEYVTICSSVYEAKLAVSSLK